jgi:hypothetical protein
MPNSAQLIRITKKIGLNIKWNLYNMKNSILEDIIKLVLSLVLVYLMGLILSTIN